MNWPLRPLLCAVDTWLWLSDLGRKLGRAVTLGDVPDGEWGAFAGFDAVRLAGVWERSPCSVLIARENEGLLAEGRRLFPDFSPSDLVGSPQAVYRYEAEPHLGGAAGLAAAREALLRRGVRLLLDFQPSRVAVDHPWVFECPSCFVRVEEADLRRTPGLFFEAGGLVFAHARGPDGVPFPDAAQLDVSSPDARQAAVDALCTVAAQCDGVWCEGAALALSSVFSPTWGERARPAPTQEYWADVIPDVRAEAPGVVFLAGGCGDLAWELQQLGFDFCSDERLRERIGRGDAEGVRLHLGADPAFQERLVRFADADSGSARHRAAAVAAAALPGARLFRVESLSGHPARPFSVLGRRPDEAPDPETRDFCGALLAELRAPALREGEWRLCETSGWPDNPSHRNLLAWCWRAGENRRLVAVNLSPSPSQALVRVPWQDLVGRSWRLTDAFSGESFDRDGGEMLGSGLYVGLGPSGFHFLKIDSG